MQFDEPKALAALEAMIRQRAGPTSVLMSEYGEWRLQLAELHDRAASPLGPPPNYDFELRRIYSGLNKLAVALGGSTLYDLGRSDEPQPSMPRPVIKEPVSPAPRPGPRDPGNYLNLSPADKRRISSLLESAFTPDELQQLVADYLPALASEIPWRGEGLTRLVFLTRDAAIRHNLLDELLLAAVETRPRRSDLLALSLELAQRPGWGKTLAPNNLDVGVALEKVTSGSGDPFIDTTPLARWMIAVERQVCQVRCGRDYGTGFLVAADLVLTCCHVVEERIARRVSLADTQVRFDFRRSVTGEMPLESTLTWVALDPDWQIVWAPKGPARGEPAPHELDFALLKLAVPVGKASPPGEKEPRGWIDLSQDPSLPEPGSAMFIVQHPQTSEKDKRQRPLQIALATPGYEGVNDGGTRMTYTPSTLGGSSGSPVFDCRFAAVAMHQSAGQTNVNVGVPLASIRAALPEDIRSRLTRPTAVT